ncbi:MAG: group 1 truncated hemoglobin [Bacteroidales bacterium]|nr:group 1 truncated hemoglobin [Bacteroidales bacterium]MCF8455980.1 group 1 truncated hemoglobin [Bacteroidales bacterium]
MKKLFSMVLVLLSFALFTNAENSEGNDQKSLFERLGGTEGITKIVDDVVEAHMNNPAISARFSPYGKQPERLAVIKKHTIEFFSMGSGAQIAYTGKDMPTTHAGMNISAAEYMCVVDDIMMVLDKHKIDEESKKDVLAILWSLKGMIMAK